MPSRDLPIALIPHYAGPVEVSGLESIAILPQAPGEGGLELPDNVMEVEPHVLHVVSRQPGRIVLASRGGGARLDSQRALIDRAREEGTAVEIHVFDDLPRED